jgi:tetracycline resistance efflux pump
MHQGSWVSLVPALSVLILALVTRRTFEALLGGTLIGYVITSGFGFFDAFTRSMLSVMKDETVGWITLVVGLFGSLIALLVRSRATNAFGDRVAALVKSARGALVATWFMGLVIFLDDYLNALAVGAAMAPVTDRFRISREKLAYIVDSTAAPVCVLVPLSTWAFYVAGLFEGVGAAPAGGGLALYRSVIPFVVYAWVAVLLVPLVAWGVVPDLGPMKRAEARARDGQLAPDDSPSFDEAFGTKSSSEGDAAPRLSNFLIPLATLIGFSWYLNDALKGVLIAVFLTVGLFLVRQVLSFKEISETFFVGFQSMVYPLGIVVVSFGLRNVNEDLGLTQYVIDSVRPIMSGALLPAVAFVSLSLIAFATGSFWGVYAVSLPIIVPLAKSMGVSLPLALGAVVSAGAFGSHACFYGDATVLSASASGCNILSHAYTQLPYALIGAAISAAVFVALGALS